MATNSSVRGGPRDRLLEAAKRLTYSQGPGIGVDALLREAQVARRSLYEHFGGKDGLLLEVIRQAATEDEEWIRSTLDAGGDDPRGRLLGLFDELDRVVTRPGFRGCRYLGADLGFAAADHPIHRETTAYRQRVRAVLENELVDLGHPSPQHAAEQLQLLIEGVLATGAAATVAHPGRVARALADTVLAQAA
ncbi:TetR/AcrR family transcriptional regulator [Streptomyces sp. B6B3]|uniref:TetR/AcrR family transcriptional regulator n=1 Tax=Streptomyces sp. B6B3 TaxID=3153570 RepID=UPI00325E4C40